VIPSKEPMDIQEIQKVNSGGRRKVVLLCIGSVIFSLLIAEVASRRFLSRLNRVDRTNQFLSFHQPDPRIGWVLTSDSMKFRHRLVLHGELQYDVIYTVTNGHRLTSAHPHDGPAIITTGCSFTFGHGVNDQDTWPWLLQEKLPTYEVINVGVMAYGTDQALMAAERQVLSSPHHTTAVVLGLADFQIERNRSSQRWLVFAYPFAKPFFAMNSGDVEYERQVRFWAPGSLGDHSSFFAHLTDVLADTYYGIPSHDRATQLTAALVTTFAKRFQALGVRFAVVLLPWPHDQFPQPQADRTFLIEHLRAAQIPTLVPDFPRLADGGIDLQKFMVSEMDAHPNRQYNMILTDQLQRFLQSNGITSSEHTVTDGANAQTRMLSHAEVGR
jgi:hypothetical protein